MIRVFPVVINGSRKKIFDCCLCFRSNCDPFVREELRKYYTKPGFLPDDAETGDQDWIFMGGPGPGAPIHVSNHLHPTELQLSLYVVALRTSTGENESPRPKVDSKEATWSIG